MKEAALRIDGSQKRRGGIAGVESGGFGILHCPDGGSAIGILSQTLLQENGRAASRKPRINQNLIPGCLY